MRRLNRRNIGIFSLGMLVCAAGMLIYSLFVKVRRPEPVVSIENRGEICFQVDDHGDMIASVAPEGCFSTTCTRQIQRVGKAVVDSRGFEIRFETRFLLAETSSFPLPCVENCMGGGTIEFNLGMLEVGDHDVWHGNEYLGKLKVFSGLPTPPQCFPE